MALKKIYIAGFITLISIAIFSVGYHQYDEHFQVLEFAGLKLGLTSPSELPWEYHYQMRPALQPFITVGVYKTFQAVGLENPFYVAIFLRIMSALLSCLSTVMLIRAFLPTIKSKQLHSWLAILSFFLWFIAYGNVRFSSENWSSTLFLIAFALLFRQENKSLKYYLFSGLLMGFSFVCRYQIVFLIIGFVAWLIFVKKIKISQLLVLTLGGLTAFLIGVLIDRWFYGDWVLTSWNYFNQNIVMDKVSGFGIKPWWYYFVQIFGRLIPPYSLLLLVSIGFVYFRYPKHAFTWTTVPFLLAHILIGHKETRFLFPLAPFVPVFIILFVDQLHLKYDAFRVFASKKISRILLKISIGVHVVFLGVAGFTPAAREVQLLGAIYNNHKEATTIYYLDEDPYLRLLNIHFYRPDNVTTIKVASFDSIPENVPSNSMLVINKWNEMEQVPQAFELIYSSDPLWLTHFDINGWLSRKGTWQLYRIPDSGKF